MENTTQHRAWSSRQHSIEHRAAHAPPEELDEVEGEAGDAGDDGGLPQEVQGLDELPVWRRELSRNFADRLQVGELPTEELPEDDEGEQVEQDGAELRQHHQPVPRPDGERHHGELREDEGGVGDGHHVDELILKQQERAEHDDAALVTGVRPGLARHLVHRDEHPDEEGLVGEGPALSQLLV